MKSFQYNKLLFKNIPEKKGNENLKTQIGIRQCNTSKKNRTHVNA